jgi:hypothetical protein
MKKVIKLTYFLLIFPLFSWGQDTTNNFRFVENEIVWQRIYKTSLTFEKLLEK